MFLLRGVKENLSPTPRPGTFPDGAKVIILCGRGIYPPRFNIFYIYLHIIMLIGANWAQLSLR